eukprot:TRINITY_DN89161_c0_g1_i1.p1 TRINITY_DN89161_c0_g1~~TRINITY_DN89161_c0_g1_i1.p1  ORF type:complete len:356 (+),score=58.76 TRINITY_DN89161_c0_g1_i1:30-1070(+)
MEAALSAVPDFGVGNQIESPEADIVFEDGESTIVLKGLHHDITLQWLEGLLKENQSVFDFIFLPWDRHRACNVGLAVINFIDSAMARFSVQLLYRINAESSSNSSRRVFRRICKAHHHGLAANLAHFLRTAGLHAVRDEHVPLVLEGGKCKMDVCDALCKYVSMEMLLGKTEGHSRQQNHDGALREARTCSPHSNGMVELGGNHVSFDSWLERSGNTSNLHAHPPAPGQVHVAASREWQGNIHGQPQQAAIMQSTQNNLLYSSTGVVQQMLSMGYVVPGMALAQHDSSANPALAARAPGQASASGRPAAENVWSTATSCPGQAPGNPSNQQLINAFLDGGSMVFHF